MAITSYNESKNKQSELRHIFLPGGYGIASEIIIAVLALVIFNISALNSQLFSDNFNLDSGFSVWSQVIKQLLDKLGQYTGAQQVVLFGLWAVAGALIYILVFRLIQITLGVRQSVKLGVKYVRQDHDKGLSLWLASLHDFFVKALIVVVGTVAIATGAVVCFGVASQELNNAFSKTFPHNIELLLISLVAAVLSARIIVIGVSLLSPRFRSWYTNW
jgi:hypothetical protein